MRASVPRHILVFALLFLGGVMAAAQTTALQALASYDSLVRDYNVITFGNLTLNGTHTDGGIAVGGNLSLGSGTVLAMHSVAATSSNPSLYVNGQVVLNGGAQLNNGYASTPNLSNSVAWTYNPANNQYQRGLASNGQTLSYNTSNTLAYSDPRTVAGPAGWSWSAVQSEAISVSMDLASLAATGTVSRTGQTLTFVSDASGVTVFTLDASKFSNGGYDFDGNGSVNFNTEGLSGYVANLANDQYFVINVINATSADGSLTFLQGLNGNAGTNNDQLLWNIIPDSNAATADTLNLGANLYGSVLAPLVNIQSNGRYLNGQVVAGSYTQSGAEIHYAGGYDGPVAFSPVPEPSTYALLGSVLCVAGIVVRRFRNSRRPA